MLLLLCFIQNSNYTHRQLRIRSSHLSSSQQMDVMSQDLLEFAMQGLMVGNSSDTPSPETVAQIKFKNLPSYEVIGVILKPTFLAGKDRCTLRNFPEGTKESRFKLFVPLKAINFVSMNRNISLGKRDYPYQFHIRISQLEEPMTNEVTDCMPLGLHIRLGGKTCPLPPMAPHTRPGDETRRSPRPIDCTDLVKLSPFIPNEININWFPDGKKYVLSMVLVKRRSSETLIQSLEQGNEEQAADTIQPVAVVDSKPQDEVQPQQEVTSSGQ